MAILKIKDGSQWAEVPALVGSPGISPIVTVTDITNGHRVTITDTNGAHNFDVMDGESHALTAADKAEIAQQVAEEVDVPVQDVQVNGVSVLDAQGVANVPKAGSDYGVSRISSSLGVTINGNGYLHTNTANNDQLKAGTDSYRPITPNNQHASTFFGLAKAAGTDMASSNNSVGTYTDEAKTAIRSMLGIQNFNPQSIAIVANGDTHAAITSGQYVYVQNHSTLTEGLYAASSAIAVNGALSTTNLTAVSGGGLNALNGKLSLLEISSGTVTEVQSLTTSGTYFNYTVPTSGWYTVRATTANTSGSGFARIAVGNTVIMHVSASLGQYDLLLPAPLFLKEGTAIKAMAGFPANGGGSILKIA